MNKYAAPQASPVSSLSAFFTLLHDDATRQQTHQTVLRMIADRIVPPDDGTPGGSASGAFDYLWAQLMPGGDLEKEWDNYQAALWDAYYLAEQMFGVGFTDLSPNQQDEVLRTLEKQNPRFFARMVEHVQEGFYISQAAWDMIGWKVTA